MSSQGRFSPSPPIQGDPSSCNRLRMVEEQIAARGIRDARVLEAIRVLPREAFVPPELRNSAYDDRALPVGFGQTISQPYIVALMSEALAVERRHKVLEIGTGTGYQTAILAMLADHVFTVERLPELSGQAESRLRQIGFNNVDYRVSDGSAGWPEASPFDRIIVTAAAPEVIPALVDQLSDDGILVAPIGEETDQRLTRIERVKGRLIERPMIPVRFVHLIGSAGYAS